MSKAQLAKKEPHLMGEIKKRVTRARVRGEAWQDGVGRGHTEILAALED